MTIRLCTLDRYKEVTGLHKSGVHFDASHITAHRAARIEYWYFFKKISEYHVHFLLDRLL